MLTLEQIKELAEMVARLELGRVEVERSGFRVRIDGKRPAPVMAASASLAPAAPTAATPASPASADGSGDAEDDALPEGTEVLPSPIVGTFFRAPSPDADPFVEVGDRVKVGQVLCIVEAMKLMNEIEADEAGTIVEIYAQNGKPVEYGQPLFAIRAD